MVQATRHKRRNRCIKPIHAAFFVIAFAFWSRDGNAPIVANSTTNTSTEVLVRSPVQEFPITIVTRLVGETGNWLLYIIKAQSLQLRLKQLGIDSTVRYQVRHRMNGRVASTKFIKTCFPNLRDLDFDERQLSQPSFLNKATGECRAWFATLQDQATFNLDFSQELTEAQERDRLQRLQQLLRTHAPALGLQNVSLPFLHVRSFASPHDYNDYYEELRELLKFDDEKCCGQFPNPQSSVFVSVIGRPSVDLKLQHISLTLHNFFLQHFRGFAAEEDLSKSRQFGREELSPKKVASDLFRHLGPGDRLSLLSRFDASSELVNEHIKALESKGVSVEFVHQSPENDFCYLRHAQKELVGFGYSTYVRVAGFLAKFRPKVRLYCLDSPDTRRLGTANNCRYFDFDREKHGHLQDSFISEIFQSEELDSSASAEKAS